MDEQWRPVRGYEGIYEVSNLGQVKRIAPWGDGRANRIRGIRHLNPKKYMRITLYWNRTKKEFPVHRLVFEAFSGPIPEGCQINHKNGRKHDNRPENLEAMTPSENQKHSYRVLNRVKVTLPGSDHFNAKLTNADVLEIRRLKAAGLFGADIAARFGIHKNHVYDIVNGKRWGWLKSA